MASKAVRGWLKSYGINRGKTSTPSGGLAARSVTSWLHKVMSESGSRQAMELLNSLKEMKQ